MEEKISANKETMDNIAKAIDIIVAGVAKRVDVNQKVSVYSVGDNLIRIDIKR